MKKGIHIQKLLRLAREESGAILVEFSLSVLILMTLLFGTLNWMFGMYAYHFVTYAAQQGSRYAMVRGSAWGSTTCSTSAPPNFTLSYNCQAASTDIQNYVQSLASPGINAANVTINTSDAFVWPAQTPDGLATPCATYANLKGCLVKVQVSYNFNLIPFAKVTSFPITATSEKVVLQ